MGQRRRRASSAIALLYSERLLAHFQSPRNAGELPGASITVDAENPACGDRLRLSVRLDGERIAEARFLAKGCTASIAAGSALTVWLTGKSLAEVAGAGKSGIRDAVEAELGGLPPASRHAAALCADAAGQLLKSR